MSAKDAIYSQFLQYSASSHGLYIKIPLALEYVDECAKNDLAVIGIECFVYHDDGMLTPRSDLIADYSSAVKGDWPACKEICNKAAMEFLIKLRDIPDLAANFVVISDEDRDSSND